MNDPKSISDDEFLARWMAGELDDQEVSRLESLLDTNPELGRSIQDLKRVWAESGKLSVPAGRSLAERWATLEATIAVPGSSKRHQWKRIAPLAGTIAAALLLVYLFWPSPGSVDSVTAARGSVETVDLPDGSRAVLNADSRIEFDSDNWEKLRQVTMEGEVFFEVKKGSATFRVNFGPAQVTVLGTSFNVRYRRKGSEIACISGTVGVETAGSRDQRVKLGQGMAVLINSDTSLTQPYPIDPEKQIGWLSGKFYFNKTPIPDVFAEIERQFDVEIHLPKNLNYSFTGRFDRLGVEEALHIVCLSLGLSYQAEPDSSFSVFFEKEVSR